VSAISAGQIVNLVSNDARRFDDYGPHLPFLIFAPLELIVVLALVAQKLGIVPAIAGIGLTLLVFPVQALIASFIAATRRSTAQQTDERVRLTGEIISGILSVKLLSWEILFANLLDQLRSGEAKFLHHMNRVRTLNTSLLFLLPPLVSFATFAVYRGIGNTHLDVPTVFFVLALFQLPRTSLLLAFTFAVQTITELKVSISRINEFLLSPEPPPMAEQDIGSDEYLAFSISNDDVFSWSADSKKETTDEDLRQASSVEFTLSGIGINVPQGCLLGITGDVGSGKSSFLSILLGDLLPRPRSESHEVSRPVIRGTIAYCSQIPFIVSGSIQDNIIFGSSFDQEWYSKVVEACALSTDLDSLPAGDQTELGERGINLSGGQKARIALARAVYSQRSTVLMDDTLAAVDSRVGKILFDQAIKDLLGGATRVLVTHQLHVLPRCDLVAVMRKGRMVGLGTWEQVKALDLPELNHMTASASVDELSEQIAQSREEEPVALSQEESEINVVEMEEPQPATASVVIHISEENKPSISTPMPLSPSNMSRALSRTRTFNFFRRPAPLRKEGGGDETFDVFVEDEAETKPPEGFFRGFSRKLTRLVSSAVFSMTDVTKKFQESNEQEANSKGKLIKAEHRTEGDVAWEVYKGYGLRFGVLTMSIVFVLLVCGQAAYVASDWWLALWSRGQRWPQADLQWLWSYSIIMGVLLALSYPRSALFFYSSTNATSNIHHRMARSVFRSPLSFFHQNPVGRIVNRFARDLSIIDDQLPMNIFDTVQCALLCLGAFVLVSIAVPVIIPVFLPLLWLFYVVRQRYVVASRNSKRFEATTRSPVFAFFGQTIKGLPTIRAYAAADRFQRDFLSLLSLSGAWSYASIATARWVGFRLDLICSITLAVAALLSVAVSSTSTISIQPQLLGLALTYLMSIMGILQWMVRIPGITIEMK
jgi:ATP-binding cassette subfamily C (CFTR/MRP) protein 1